MDDWLGSDKEHSYAVGTCGDHKVLGKLMRREAAKRKINEAAQTYSVTDGAPWILRQYKKQLPMVETTTPATARWATTAAAARRSRSAAR